MAIPSSFCQEIRKAISISPGQQSAVSLVLLFLLEQAGRLYVRSFLLVPESHLDVQVLVVLEYYLMSWLYRVWQESLVTVISLWVYGNCPSILLFPITGHVCSHQMTAWGSIKQ